MNNLLDPIILPYKPVLEQSLAPVRHIVETLQDLSGHHILYDRKNKDEDEIEIEYHPCDCLLKPPMEKIPPIYKVKGEFNYNLVYILSFIIITIILSYFMFFRGQI